MFVGWRPQWVRAAGSNSVPTSTVKRTSLPFGRIDRVSEQSYRKGLRAGTFRISFRNMSSAYRIVCIKGSRTFTWPHQPATREAALSVGHELTRDKVADFFRVEAPLPWWKS